MNKNFNLSLAEFAKTLAGVYDNIEQSQKDPKDFARINIFFRPLPWHISKDQAFIRSNVTTMHRGIPTDRAFTD